MAALILLTWVSYLPSVALHSLDIRGSLAVILIFTFQIIVAPLLALAIIWLAVRGERLKLATALAIMPTLVAVLSVVAFGVGVALYGF